MLRPRHSTTFSMRQRPPGARTGFFSARPRAFRIRPRYSTATRGHLVLSRGRLPRSVWATASTTPPFSEMRHPPGARRTSPDGQELVMNPQTEVTVADQLRALGTRGVLVQMAKRRQIIELRCEMPMCYCHKGRGYFDPRSTPLTDWAPTPDHYPQLRADGGQLVPWNV